MNIIQFEPWYRELNVKIIAVINATIAVCPQNRTFQLCDTFVALLLIELTSQLVVGHLEPTTTTVYFIPATTYNLYL